MKRGGARAVKHGVVDVMFRIVWVTLVAAASVAAARSITTATPTRTPTAARRTYLCGWYPAGSVCIYAVVHIRRMDARPVYVNV